MELNLPKRWASQFSCEFRVVATRSDPTLRITDTIATFDRIEDANAAWGKLHPQQVAQNEPVATVIFNPRTEVSADAKYIVRHLWIILIVLPVVFGILYALLTIR